MVAEALVSPLTPVPPREGGNIFCQFYTAILYDNPLNSRICIYYKVKHDTDSEPKDCADRFMITKSKDGMTAVNKLFYVFTAPQNAVTPGRRTTLVAETFP